MHALNSTCIKKCLPRGTECPVLSLTKCHRAMQCIVTYTRTQHALLDWILSLSFSPTLSLSICLQSSTLYQYLKCNLSPPFQSEWLLWRLHWKVAGLGTKKKNCHWKSYFYRSELIFVSNVFYLINGTKEAKTLAIVPRWRGHRVAVYDTLFFWSFAIGLPLYQGTIYDFISWLYFHSLFCTISDTSLFVCFSSLIVFFVFYLIRKLFLVAV